MNELKAQEQKFQQENAKLTADATDRQTQSNEVLKREGYKNNLDVAKVYADNKAVTDEMRNQSQEKIKLAELEQKMLSNSKKNTN